MDCCQLLRPWHIVLGLLFSTVGASLANTITAAEPVIDMPLVAHWTFNAAGPTAAIEEVSGDSTLRVKAAGSVARARGVHGAALQLVGNHSLATRIAERMQGLSRITFSAWTRPTDLSGFREIFRQECPQRLLFSFQHSGSILSPWVERGRLRRVRRQSQAGAGPGWRLAPLCGHV